jgi:hypothetical protein
MEGGDMLDLACFILASIPLVTGLTFVFISFRERRRLQRATIPTGRVRG